MIDNADPTSTLPRFFLQGFHVPPSGMEHGAQRVGVTLGGFAFFLAGD